MACLGAAGPDHPHPPLASGAPPSPALRERGDPGAAAAGPREPCKPVLAGHVLDLPFTQILRDKGQPVAHLVMDRVGDEHSAGISQGLDPRGDIDAVTREFELPGEDAVMRKEGETLIIEPAPPKSLLALLAPLPALDEEFPAIPDAAPDPVEP